MSSGPFAVVTGGGTGGHVSPALAVAEALAARGRPRSQIVFVGGRHGIESRLVPEAGFELRRLPGRGIERRLRPRNLRSVLELASACAMALAMVVRDRPRVVVTVGGYAGLPYSLAAVACRVPLLVVNVDAVPGAANRLVGRFATASAVAFERTPLRRAVVTGPPVRRSVLEVSTSPEARAKVRAELGFDQRRRLVVVTGGSLGAATLNQAALELAERLAGRGDLALYHLAGERNLAEVRADASARGLFELPVAGLQYRLVGYDPGLANVLGACDLAICRAGASTVAELTAIGVPSVLVPLPRAPGDHQSKNAEVLATAGAARVVADGDCDGETLGKEVAACLDDDARRGEMAAAARRLGRPDAAEQVAALAEQLAKGTRTRRRG